MKILSEGGTKQQQIFCIYDGCLLYSLLLFIVLLNFKIFLLPNRLA